MLGSYSYNSIHTERVRDRERESVVPSPALLWLFLLFCLLSLCPPFFRFFSVPENIEPHVPPSVRVSQILLEYYIILRFSLPKAAHSPRCLEFFFKIEVFQQASEVKLIRSSAGITALSSTACRMGSITDVTKKIQKF